MTLADAGALHRTRTGTGEPVVWLHGYTMDATVWAPTWDALPGWHHVGVDLPGHGASPPLARGRTRAEVADTVAAILREEGARRLVALSFGTLVALELAVRHPDLVDRLVLAAPTIAGAAHAPGTERRYRELAALHATFGPGPHLTGCWMTSPPDIFAGTLARPAVRERIRAVVDRHGWRELADGAMQGITGGEQPAAALRGIRADVLALVGDGDMPAFADNAATLARVVPRCRVEVVPDAGHLTLLEVPARVAGTVAAHLAGGAPVTT